MATRHTHRTPWWTSILAALTVALTVVGLSVSPAFDDAAVGLTSTQFDLKPQAPGDLAEVAAAVQPGLVQINTDVGFQNIVGNGTGILLSPDGEVLTNRHVVQGANGIQVTIPATGQTFEADVIGYDRRADVALLRLRGASGLPTAPIGDSAQVAVGDSVVSIGNANGTGNPLTGEQGSVVGLGQTVQAEDELTGSANELNGLIEATTMLRPGDSGGALINSGGQVIGMNAAGTINFRMGTSGNGFAIPINNAVGIAAQIRSGAASASVHIGPSALLGIGVNSAATRDGSGSGVVIRQTLRGGPAEAAGLQPGDLLTSLDGTALGSANVLTDVLDQRYPGQVVDVTWVDRTGQERTAKVTLTTGAVS